GTRRAGNASRRTERMGLAWMGINYQPASALSCWFRQRVGSERGRIRRISIVALARKLLIALSRYINHGEIPAGAIVKPVLDIPEGGIIIASSPRPDQPRRIRGNGPSPTMAVK